MGSGRGRPQCSYCGDMGHWVQKCFQLHGYPPDHPKARINLGSNSNRNKSFSAANQVSEADEGKPAVALSEAQLKQLLSLLNNQDENSSSKVNAVTKPGLSKVASRNWIIDSGATDHITSSSKLLHKDKNCSLPLVLLPSGEKTNIVTKGTLPLNSVYYLHDVLSVPTFKDLATRRTIGLGKQRDGLYYLVALATEKSLTNHSSSTNQPACNLAISSTDLWHSCLGHVSPSRLSFIAKNFLNFFVQSNNACPICPLAKQSCLPFAYATNVHTSHKFDYRAMPSIFIGYPVGQKAYKLFDLSTKKVFTSRDVKFHEDIFPYVSLKPNSTLSSFTHNSGPIPLVAHDISSSLDSTSHALSPLLSNHTSTLSPTTENDDFSSLSRHSELIIEPSSQIDPNPSPPPSTTLVSPSPVPPFASIPSVPPAETHSPKPATPLRRSSRHIAPPIKLHDYVCSHVSSNQSSFLIPGPTKEPRSYLEAAAHPEWQEAMCSELQALQANDTWFLTPLSPVRQRLAVDGIPLPHRQDHICPLLACIAAARGWASATGEENLVCRLHKSLYGLKQASRQWFAKFSEAIQSVGYAHLESIILCSPENKARLLGAAPIDTPMERGLKLSDKSDLLKDQGRYRRLVGRLIYLTMSRLDITYAVHVLSWFMHQPRKAHMEAAFRVVRYLKNTPGQGLFFSSNNDFRLRAYCDSNWAGCPLTRRSTVGYCVFLGPLLISWRSKRQKTVSLSSTEAEYRAMTRACCELTWLRYLLKDLVVLHQEPALLYCDNKATLHIAANPVFHERTRHIEMDCHYIRDKIQDGSIITRHVSSAHQLANILTKPLGKEIFAPMIRKGQFTGVQPLVEYAQAEGKRDVIRRRLNEKIAEVEQLYLELDQAEASLQELQHRIPDWLRIEDTLGKLLL
ncbi:Retrovirus-related Pol polyprotein from transposon RE1 [Vitis vinifera]|uniref:Retrovirus-related Pol polyprotein from transposon RE1 n=1 Tax=Vitis vinifera TaxID=29760 RepID=A0A438FYD2_VITVI|nr:Retrovirus-related Pol polyprotein from transposon RE1 [Vitis vinifera]